MTRLVDQQIDSLVQVVDSNGDKVTDAVVNFKVYRWNGDTEVWEAYDSGLMEHIGDGVYVAYWLPEWSGNTLSMCTAATRSSMKPTPTILRIIRALVFQSPDSTTVTTTTTR